MLTHGIPPDFVSITYGGGSLLNNILITTRYYANGTILISGRNPAKISSGVLVRISQSMFPTKRFETKVPEWCFSFFLKISLVADGPQRCHLLPVIFKDLPISLPGSRLTIFNRDASVQQSYKKGNLTTRQPIMVEFYLLTYSSSSATDARIKILL